MRPPEAGVSLSSIQRRHTEAHVALARLETLVRELPDPYIISRILPRREAVSSSAIEGTHSTLDELLAVEETDDPTISDAATQVRDYAIALDDLVPRAREQGPSIFTENLIRDLH